MTTAHLIATGNPHPLAAHLALDRFATGRTIDERGLRPVSVRALKRIDNAEDPLPLVRAARRDRVSLSRRCRATAPGSRIRRTRTPFVAYVYERSNPRDWHAEWWLHVGGCRRLLKIERHTLTHEIRAVADSSRGAELMRGPARVGAGSATAATQPLQFRFDGRLMQGIEPATRSLRRCWPMACASSRAASSTTGRAVC
jgi:heterotetrameric sarcosine oxidase delta subunit